MLMITIPFTAVAYAHAISDLGQQRRKRIFDGRGGGENPGRGAKFVMSKREPEQEANRVCQAIATQIGKFMAAQGIATLQSTESR